MRGADIDPHQLSHPGLEALENRGAGQEAEGDQEVERAAPEGREARGDQEAERGRRAGIGHHQHFHRGAPLVTMTGTRGTMFEHRWSWMENGISGFWGNPILPTA